VHPDLSDQGFDSKAAAWLLNEQTMTRPAKIDAALKAKIALEVVREVPSIVDPPFYAGSGSASIQIRKGACGRPVSTIAICKYFGCETNANASLGVSILPTLDPKFEQRTTAYLKELSHRP
jgi:hypothetical protein